MQKQKRSADDMMSEPPKVSFAIPSISPSYVLECAREIKRAEKCKQIMFKRNEIQKNLQSVKTRYDTTVLELKQKTQKWIEKELSNTESTANLSVFTNFDFDDIKFPVFPDFKLIDPGVSEILDSIILQYNNLCLKYNAAVAQEYSIDMSCKRTKEDLRALRNTVDSTVRNLVRIALLDLENGTTCWVSSHAHHDHESFKLVRNGMFTKCQIEKISKTSHEYIIKFKSTEESYLSKPVIVWLSSFLFHRFRVLPLSIGSYTEKETFELYESLVDPTCNIFIE